MYSNFGIIFALGLVNEIKSEKNFNYHRRSIRLKGYDYSQSGMYFITICAKDKKCLFGEIIDEEIMLNKLGKIVKKCWQDIPVYFPDIELDEYIIMPNHLHGIIFITNSVGATLAVAHDGNGKNRAAPHLRGAPTDGNIIRAGASPAPTIGNIIGSFKSISANEWLNYIKQNDLNILGKFWQRNYYEHIIRTEQSLNEIRNYIFNNAGSWQNDIENPTVYKNISRLDREKYYKNIC